MASEKSLRSAGRPPADEVFNWWPRFLDGLRQGMTRAAAAKRAGVARSNAHAAMKRHPDMYAEAVEAEDEALEVAGAILLKIATDDEHHRQFDAAKFIVERRLKDWAKRDTVDVNATIDVNVAGALEDPDSLRDKLDHLLARIERRALEAGDVVDAEVIDDDDNLD